MAPAGAAAAAGIWLVPIVAGISDQAVKATEAVLADAKKRLTGVDETRIYLVGLQASTPEVFYTVSREPDLWAAALAIQGSAGPAINSFRLFGANTQETRLYFGSRPRRRSISIAASSRLPASVSKRGRKLTSSRLSNGWPSTHGRYFR